MIRYLIPLTFVRRLTGAQRREVRAFYKAYWRYQSLKRQHRGITRMRTAYGRRRR